MLNKINLNLNYFCELNQINENQLKWDNTKIDEKIKIFYYNILEKLIKKNKINNNIFTINVYFNFMLFKYELSSNNKEIKNFSLKKNYEKIKSYFILIKMILDNKLNIGKNILKREIFYNYINYFENQLELDKRIKELSFFLKVKRSDLNIFSSSKGLVYGNLIIEINSNQFLLNDLNFKEGFLINFENFKIINHQIQNIIVIEKETIFYNLIQNNIKEKLPNTLIITGKGYPDYKTKYFIKILINFLKLPIFYIGDFDPFGYDIFFNYLFGSKYTIYESLELQYMIHIGIKSNDINNYSLKDDNKLKLNNYDLIKLNKLLKKEFLQEKINLNQNEVDIFILNELKTLKNDLLFMLNNNLKYEFEILNFLNINYIDFISAKLNFFN